MAENAGGHHNTVAGNAEEQTTKGTGRRVPQVALQVMQVSEEKTHKGG